MRHGRQPDLAMEGSARAEVYTQWNAAGRRPRNLKMASPWDP